MEGNIRYIYENEEELWRCVHKKWMLSAGNRMAGEF